jgi:hypothetical protein
VTNCALLWSLTSGAVLRKGTTARDWGAHHLHLSLPLPPTHLCSMKHWVLLDSKLLGIMGTGTKGSGGEGGMLSVSTIFWSPTCRRRRCSDYVFTADLVNELAVKRRGVSPGICGCGDNLLHLLTMNRVKMNSVISPCAAPDGCSVP